MLRYAKRNKSILALAAVVLACFMWMTAQVRSPGDAGFFERAVTAVGYPFVLAVERAVSGMSGLWGGYVGLVGVEGDNRRLREENARLSRENLLLREEAAKLRRAGELLAFKEQSPWPATGASAIGRDSTSWFKTVLIDKGATSGITKDMPALTDEGVVGRVSKVYGGSSRVTLITDTNSSLSCVVERTREPGILAGDGDGGCRLMYVGKHADIKRGDRVITSGLDGIFPPGLPVGVVMGVSKGGAGFFMDIEVRPAADIRRLTEVLLAHYVPPERPAEEPGDVKK